MGGDNKTFDFSSPPEDNSSFSIMEALEELSKISFDPYRSPPMVVLPRYFFDGWIPLSLRVDMDQDRKEENAREE